VNIGVCLKFVRTDNQKFRVLTKHHNCCLAS